MPMPDNRVCVYMLRQHDKETIEMMHLDTWVEHRYFAFGFTVNIIQHPHRITAHKASITMAETIEWFGLSFSISHILLSAC